MLQPRRLLAMTAATAADVYRGRFLRDLWQAGRVNRHLLREILFHNRNSEFGRCHFFSLLRTSKQYKDLVPLATYEDFSPLIQRMLRGEPNVLFPDPVRCFGLSSGTTGSPKRIPMTARSLGITMTHMTLLVQGLLHQAIPASRRMDRGLP
jgi:hypothetical protein